MTNWTKLIVDAIKAPPYAPMNPNELADLSAEAGRQLTESQAFDFLKRKINRQATEQMLRDDKPVAELMHFSGCDDEG